MRVFMLIVAGILFASSIMACNGSINCKCQHRDSLNSSVKESKLSEVQYAELKEKIICVQKENDNRSGFFTWAISLGFSLFLAIIAFSYFNNRTLAAQNAREAAKEEFIREYKIYKRKFNDMLRDINSKKEEIENLKLDFEMYQELVKRASVFSNNIEIKKNDEGSDDK